MNEFERSHRSSLEEVGAPSSEALTKVQCCISEALAHFAGGRVTTAENCLSTALRLVPEHPEVLHLLGLAAKQRGDNSQAAGLIKRALERIPHHPVFHSNLGNVLLDVGEIDTAICHYRQAIQTEPAYVDAHFNLGIALERQGKTQEAIVSYRQTLQLDPEYVEARLNLGAALESLGLIAEALVEYRRVIDKSPKYARAYYRIASASHGELDRVELQAMEGLLSKADPASDAAIHLHFGLARAYADIGREDDAFAHWESGNKAKRATYSYDVAESTQFHRRIADAFTPELLNAKARQSHDDDTPIFVVGMPRSGTTLVEQILASHPQVSGAGELTFLRDISRNLAVHSDTYPEIVHALSGIDFRLAADDYLGKLCARVPGVSRIVDKLPGNFLYIGMIKLMLPNARIVHCVRNPVATCFSCYTQLFNAPQRFTYDLTELGTFYSSYRGLMAHWQRVLPGHVFDLQYEELVGDQEAVTRRLLEFCDLEWNDSCLQFHETERPVRTASAAQVRQPMYKGALMGWRHYENHLGPLLDALE